MCSLCIYAVGASVLIHEKLLGNLLPSSTCYGLLETMKMKGLINTGPQVAFEFIVKFDCPSWSLRLKDI